MTNLRLPHGVTLVSEPLPHIAVDVAAAKGTVYLNGAHVATWTPTGADPVLWMSTESWFEEGQPIRGGVPLCFPWFGIGLTGDREPRHGFARLAQWTLTAATVDEHGATLEFTLPPDELTGLPGADRDLPGFTARYIVTMGAELKLKFVVTADESNTGPFVCEEALHPYFSVGDIRRTRVVGLDAADYLDATANVWRSQTSDVTFVGETDRIYESANSLSIVDEAKGRTLTFTKLQSNTTVVWNPWDADAARTPDLGDDEWLEFVCVEAGNARAHHLELAPGESHTLGLTIEVS